MSITINNIEELHQVLLKYGINTSRYGCDQAKTILQLYGEIVDGETILYDKNGSLERQLNVVYVLIIKNDKILLEKQQTLPTGQIRNRNIPLAEKLKSDENWKPAAIRGIVEELSYLDKDTKIDLAITVDFDSHKQFIEKTFSKSYPGIATTYLTHVVPATVSGIPDIDFKSFEKREDGYLITEWTWITIEDAQKINLMIEMFYSD